MIARDEAMAALLPEYDIGEELGRGGCGVVLAGWHRQLRREVAIKELPPALAADPRFRARFMVEARVLAKLNHPHIVPIFDCVESDGLCLLVMEKLPGGTLWDRFRQDGLSVEATCAVAMAACAALHYAHQTGVLHRDVKPENLLYSADGVLKITDFGIAKVVGGALTLATRAGEILGTPAYMAPEQLQSRELGPAADVYATGVMLYELLSGHLPYSEDGGLVAIAYRHVYEDPTPLAKIAPELEPALVEVTMRAISRAPGDRFPTAQAFGIAIGEAVTPRWGTTWLDRAGVHILDYGPIPESARRPSAASPAQPLPVHGPYRPSVAHACPAPSASPVVRPQVEDHAAGAADLKRDGDDLVPVREVIELPSPPYALLAMALTLLALTVAIAFIGLRKAPPPAIGSHPWVTMAVGGADPATTAVVKLDLSAPVQVRLTGVAPTLGVRGVQLGFSVAGIPLPPSSTVMLEATSGNVLEAKVDASLDQYLVAGTFTGDLRLVQDGRTVENETFLARSRQPAFLTMPGALVLGAGLFLLFSLGPVIAPLRRGRGASLGVAGMALLGALFGGAVVGLRWVLGSPEPSLAIVAACAASGSAAAAVAALAIARAARRARVKPKQRRLAAPG